MQRVVPVTTGSAQQISLRHPCCRVERRSWPPLRPVRLTERLRVCCLIILMLWLSLLSATYASVYAFLRARGHTKAAAAVRKASEDVIVLRDDVDTGYIPLQDAIKSWSDTQAKKDEDKYVARL